MLQNTVYTALVDIPGKENPFRALKNTFKFYKLFKRVIIYSMFCLLIKCYLNIYYISLLLGNIYAVHDFY